MCQPRLTLHFYSNKNECATIERMSAIVKLKEIAVHMDLEPDGDQFSVNSSQLPTCHTANPATQSSSLKSQSSKQELGISYAQMPNGRQMPLLKTMITTACERNCFYCPFRAGRSKAKRVTVQPEELAQTFMQMYRAGLVEGMMLSSGIIKGSVTTQDKIIATAEILRQKYQFRGYLHLKVMPGAERAQVERLMQLASRLSVNLEGPNEKRLAQLAPKKEFWRELVRPLQWIEEIRQNEPAHKGWNGRWPSSVSQFVVGGVGESDVEILSTSEYLYKQLKVNRTYFSAFTPIIDTPMENLPPTNKWRQHRLYQASFLFRDYNFDLEEMPFTQDGLLPLDTDPKTAWAQVYLHDNPVEVNRAEREQLLRVPGIGPKGAETILRARRRGTLREINHLKAIGIQTKHLKPYVLLDGQRLSYQLPLKL